MQPCLRESQLRNADAVYLEVVRWVAGCLSEIRSASSWPESHDIVQPSVPCPMLRSTFGYSVRSTIGMQSCHGDSGWRRPPRKRGLAVERALLLWPDMGKGERYMHVR